VDSPRRRRGCLQGRIQRLNRPARFTVSLLGQGPSAHALKPRFSASGRFERSQASNARARSLPLMTIVVSRDSCHASNSLTIFASGPMSVQFSRPAPMEHPPIYIASSGRSRSAARLHRRLFRRERQLIPRTSRACALHLGARIPAPRRPGTPHRHTGNKSGEAIRRS
jgi:hypothetical protein